MLKRTCDKCGKEIDVDNHYWFQMACNQMDENEIYCKDGIYELCDECFNHFKAQLANNN